MNKLKASILICFAILSFFVTPFTATSQVQAADVKFTPQVPIPVKTPETQYNYTQKTPIDFTNVKDTKPIADYIKTWFKYLSGVAGILATVFMMIGGLLWLTAGGSADKISTAKSFITSSITGLLLAFGAYLLLSTINTDLVNLRTTSIAQIKLAPTSENNPNCYISGASNEMGYKDINGKCQPLKAEGESCTDNVQCVSAKCNAGKCFSVAGSCTAPSFIVGMANFADAQKQCTTQCTDRGFITKSTSISGATFCCLCDETQQCKKSNECCGFGCNHTCCTGLSCTPSGSALTQDTCK